MRPRPSATATDTLRCDDRRTEHSSIDTERARPSIEESSPALFGEGEIRGPTMHGISLRVDLYSNTKPRNNASYFATWICNVEDRRHNKIASVE